MNILLALAPDEVEALMEHHAGRIGSGDEAEAERAMKRIEQLQRLTDPQRRYDIEHCTEDAWPMWVGFDFAKGTDQTATVALTPSRFSKDRRG